MSEPLLGEIRIFPFETAPRGWLPCNGQLVSIRQNQALYSLIGTTYGGDGTDTFGLPDLQGRLPVGLGNGVTLGQHGGEFAHTLVPAEMPSHTHQILASTAPASKNQPAPSSALAQPEG